MHRHDTPLIGLARLIARLSDIAPPIEFTPLLKPRAPHVLSIGYLPKVTLDRIAS
jgi:hypothetical protein